MGTCSPSTAAGPPATRGTSDWRATHALVWDFRRRTGERVMRLITSDEYPVDADVMRVSARVVFGTAESVARALASSRVSRSVNTCFVERHNATDRNRCSRKARKGYGFLRDWGAHRAATLFGYFGYNFCWPVRALRIKADGRWQKRTPAMAAGLADRVWSLSEWLAYPVVQRK